MEERPRTPQTQAESLRKAGTTAMTILLALQDCWMLEEEEKKEWRKTLQPWADGKKGSNYEAELMFWCRDWLEEMWRQSRQRKERRRQ